MVKGASSQGKDDSADSAGIPTSQLGPAGVYYHTQFDAEYDTQDQGREEEEYEEKTGADYYSVKVESSDLVKRPSPQASRSSATRQVECNLDSDLANDVDDEEQGVYQGERPPLNPRAKVTQTLRARTKRS